MLNKFILAAAVAVASCSTAASANEFGGIYGQVTAGFDDVTSQPDTTDVVYGANVGVNVPVGRAIVGVEATADNVFEDARELGASARLGYTFDQVMLYGEAGYTNYRDVFSRDLEGLRVGGGAEYNISDNAFISAEYRYTDFDNSKAGKHAGLIGLGLRF